MSRVNSLTSLRSAEKRALQDGTVTEAELLSLKAAAEKDGLTSAESRELRSFIARNPDRFDAGATSSAGDTTALQTCVTVGSVAVTTGDKGTLADPAVTRGAWVGVEGSLFVGGVKADDVVQGQLGDCFMLAAPR